MADIPPNELRYQQENIHEDQSQELSAFFIVCIVLSLLFPALRFASRKSGGSALKADDYTLLVGVILAQASFVVLLIYTFEAGLGKHVIALTPKQLILFPKLNYAYNILNVSCYPFIKISILLLYLRIFPAHRFRQIVWAGIAVLVCILISHTLVCIFACRPVQGFWKTDVSSKCINAVRFYWAQATLNVITDVFILLLPIPATWSLRITRRQKVGLSGLFMLGGLTCILSIVRIVYYVRFNPWDISYSFTPSGYSTAAEVTLAILCACIPTFRPLTRRLIHLTHHTRHQLTSLFSTTRAPLLDSRRPRPLDTEMSMKQGRGSSEPRGNGGMASASTSQTTTLGGREMVPDADDGVGDLHPARRDRVHRGVDLEQRLPPARIHVESEIVVARE